MKRHPLFHDADADAVLPHARAALADLRARGLAHRYVRHVRSSQAFALSLFAPLDAAGVRAVLGHLGIDDVVATEAVIFEFEDHKDRLQEASRRSPHRTQVDVVLRGTRETGERVAAFIEVKFSETDFGTCSAFASSENPDRNVCRQAGLFGGDHGRCFQLSNHGRGHRRYAEYLQEVPLTAPALRSDDGGCWVRNGRNQPMRNLALAHLAASEDGTDLVVYAVCAPTRNEAIWLRYDEFRDVFADTDRVRITSISAETVAKHHLDRGAAFTDRYAPALAETVLLHLSTDGADLHGIWTHCDGQLVSFYGVGTEAEADYAEAIILGAQWESLLTRLPRSSPYMAWWETAYRPVNEDIEDTFDRLIERLYKP